jgi:hypothetical protein
MTADRRTTGGGSCRCPPCRYPFQPAAPLLCRFRPRAGLVGSRQRFARTRETFAPGANRMRNRGRIAPAPLPGVPKPSAAIADRQGRRPRIEGLSGYRAISALHHRGRCQSATSAMMPTVRRLARGMSTATNSMPAFSRPSRKCASRLRRSSLAITSLALKAPAGFDGLGKRWPRSMEGVFNQVIGAL